MAAQAREIRLVCGSEERRQFLRRQRFAEQKALNFGAELRLQIVELLPCLHAFSDAAEAEALRQIQYAVHHGGGVGMGGDVAHE